MRICERPACGNPLPDDRKGRKYCSDECRILQHNARSNRPPQERECARCGKSFTPYKGDQKYCSRDCSYEVHLEQVGRPEGRENTDPQMERLFHNYKAKANIDITERPEGTRLVSLSDLQLPFVDEPLLDAVVAFIADFKPHDIILNGDILDCYEISDFDKRPERQFSVQTEIEMAKAIMLRLKRYAAKDCRLWWIDGNHEERYNRFLWRRAAELAWAMPDLSSLLELDSIAAGYVPYGKHIDYLGFVFTHGNFVSAQSAYTAKRHLDRYRSSGCNGHTHRLGTYSVTDMHGRSHTWYEQGAICRRDLEYVRGVANWQQGFLVGTVAAGALHPQLIHVIETDNGRGFFAGGRHYEVKD